MTKLNTPVHISSTKSSRKTLGASAATFASSAPHLLNPAGKPVFHSIEWNDFDTDTYACWVGKGSPDNAVIAVPIADIVLDKSLQVRKKTYPSTVRKYADAMEAGKEFPAIRVACIDGILVLVDGWHRIGAKASLGKGTVAAIVSHMTYEEAKWAAAQANLDCGLPLNAGEVREAFHAFMEAKMYRKGHTWLSYRDIAAQLGKPHTTIRNWIKKYHPRIFKRYQLLDPTKGYSGNPDADHFNEAIPDEPFAEVIQQAHTALDNTQNISKSLRPETRGIIIEKMRETLQKLEMHPYQLPQPCDF